MVALDKQQFDGHAPVERQLGRRGSDRHAFLNRSGAGRQQAIGAGKLNHAHAAGSYRAQALEVAERRECTFHWREPPQGWFALRAR